MIYFRSDYSQGAHPDVMKALMDTNLENTDGYGLDPHCENATRIIKELIGTEDCAVHMMIGGTNCNLALIIAALRPYEAVVSVDSGHICHHECGAIEARGHKIMALAGENGKLTPALIDRAWDEYEDEHTVIPKLVYISQPTEIGSLYSLEELKAISEKCKEKGMFFYIDGARLGSALTSPEADFSIKDLPKLCDAFYIGGTKNGALFGEALIIMNPKLNDHFRWTLKQTGGMLAKGRLIGVQFEVLLDGGENSLYYQMARETNLKAARLRDELTRMGCSFYSKSSTNQVFPILPEKLVYELEKDFFFYEWAPESNGSIPVRFVCSWGTTDEDVDELASAISKGLNG